MTITTTPDKIYSSLLSPAQIEILARSVPNTDMRERRQGNQKFKYIKKEYLYDQLDAIFGPDGWALTIDEVKVVNHEACEVKKDGHKIPGVTVTGMARTTIDVKVAGQVVLSKSNIGAHTIRQNAEDIGGAFENALKSAVTDAFKRTAAMLGRRLGADIEEQDPEELNVSEDANAPMTGNAPAAPRAAPAAAQATARPAAQPTTSATTAPAASQAQPAPQSRPAVASVQQTATPAQAAPAANAAASAPAPASNEEPASASTTRTESPSISPDAGDSLAGGNDQFAVHSKRTSDLIANIAGSNSEQLRIIAQHNFAAIKAATTEAQLRSCTAALTALLAYNASLAEPVGDLNKWVNYQIGQMNKRLSGIEGATIIEFNDLVPSA